MRNKTEIFKGINRICWVCVFMEEFMGIKNLKNIPLILSGMNSIYDAPQIKPYRQAIFNLRQITPDFMTESSLRKAVNIYNDYYYQENTQGIYKIDAENLNFERIDFLKDSSIIQAIEILKKPLDYQKHSRKIANPLETMTVNLGEENLGMRIPIDPITIPLKPRQTHQIDNLINNTQEKITIPLSDLKTLAREMDAREKQAPERKPGNWENRLNFALMTTENGKQLTETDTLELSGIKHLLGLPGAGKTTLLMLIATWLGNKGYKALFLFPSIEVARQYYTQLTFHQVKTGMLVGNSDETRRSHADNIAEAIAASGENRGFGDTIEGAELFSLNCVLPAFTKHDTSLWKFGTAPCTEIIQGSNKKGKPQKCLCPLWTMCGRNKAPRDLINTNIWVSHILSLDTQVPFHAIDEQIRYFELIARTFDLVVFDEADLVQSLLDSYGVAQLSISGRKDSIHRVILEEIHTRFAQGDNHHLFDRNTAIYSRDLSEFGDHNTTLIHNVYKLSNPIQKRYENQLVTVFQIIADLLDGLEKGYSPREPSAAELKTKFSKNAALTSFWIEAAYTAFYNRTGSQPSEWNLLHLSAKNLGIEKEQLQKEWQNLSNYFRDYLAENLMQKKDKIIENITQLFLNLCFPENKTPGGAEDVVKLLICITFMIFGYQRIVPGTRTMIAEGLIRESIISPTPSSALKSMIPVNILGSFSGVKYSFSTNRDVEIAYDTFMGAPRMLMHRFHELFKAENREKSPAVLMTSATSFLEASPAYHIQTKPNYLLKPEKKQHSSDSKYYFLCLTDTTRENQPLRYSGAGEFRDENLKKMVEQLVKGGETSHIYKQIRDFDIQHDIPRKAALVVNSYEQARNLKKYLNDYYPEIGKKTKAIVKFLKEGEGNKDYLTPAQCPVVGDDENCDILIFPMSAIGRGVNIVYTQGKRKLDAAIGSIYFLTRPHPTMDDLQLLYSLAGEASQNFDQHIFTENDDLDSLVQAWEKAKKELKKKIGRLFREPLMASRLSPPLFKAFTANQMINILQTIGRGMRNGCPVQVFFVDAAWASNSALGKTESARSSMLVQMRIILEECVNHPDTIKREIYQELYGAFLQPLKKVSGVKYSDDLRSSDDEDDDYDYDYYDDSDILEL